MKTIKYILVTLLIVAINAGANAATTTDRDATNYKSSIMSYVKTEGYAPKYDSDGDIQFKHEGSTYFILVSPYDDGYYVVLMTTTNVEGYNINKVRKAMDESVRSFKFVRSYTNTSETGVITQYGWYCVSITDFKRMFANALNVVSSADKKFINKMLE